ncbi:MAG: hypothetical protein ACQEQF_07990 [Bacillota bacterium]
MNAKILDLEDWSKVLLIFSEFDYDISKYENNNDNLLFLWNELLKIRSKWQKKIKKLIRLNINLCFNLDQEKLIKKVNHPLYRLNSLFEKDFFSPNNNAIIAFKKILQAIKDIFGNFKKFKRDIILLKKVDSFYNNRNDRLLTEYFQYIKRIALPVSGFEELRIALFTILKKFEHLLTLMTVKTVFDCFIEELQTFKEKYIAVYLEEHKKYQAKMNKFRNELHSLDEYRVLQLLSKINIIRSSYGLQPIMKHIDDFFPKYCEVNNVKNILEFKVKCNCGFVLNEHLLIPSIKKIKPLLKKGINDYLNQLKTKKHIREKLEKYSEINNDDKLTIILNHKKDNFNDLYSVITEELVNKINLALGESNIININGHDLINNITGSYYLNNLNTLSKIINKKIEKIVNKKYNSPNITNEEVIIVNIVKE